MKKKTTTLRAIHLTAPAGSPRADLKRLGVSSAQGLIRLVRQHVGNRYRITGNPARMEFTEDETHGGRRDDAARARELETVFRSDNVAAFVAIRGGSWFTRILPAINFDLLKRRKRSLHIFGFSEMTSLVNIAGTYDKVVGVYDLCPGYVFSGMMGYALRNLKRLSAGVPVTAGHEKSFAAGWAAGQTRTTFLEFFNDAIAMIEGRQSSRPMTGRVLAGRVPAHSTIRVIGGNLSVLLPLLASPFAKALDPTGKWIAIEDLNEELGQLDRMLAALKLAGCFERAKGIFLGDFHNDAGELTDQVAALLKHHLPPGRRLPVVRLNELGHVWPIAPLPLHRPLTLTCKQSGKSAGRITLIPTWGR